ncbi:MAG: TolC family protein, partial [Spirochaetaceae bacterium]|nr:TolC family protein [Spirochaetaceae bacterium]
ITLRQYLGLEPDSPVELIPLGNMELAEGSGLENLIPAAINNLEMRSSRLQLEISEKNRKLSRGNMLSPSLGLSLGWSTGINPLFESDSWTRESWGDNLGLGISLSVPIDSWLKGSDDQQSLLRLDDSIGKAELSLDDSLRKMKDSISSLLLDLELNRTNIEVNELNIALQEQTFNKVRQNYETGMTSLLDLDNSRQELQKALVALEEEKLKRNLLIIDLNLLTGD